MPRVEILMRIPRRMESTPGDIIYLRILKATRRWRSRKIFTGLQKPEDTKK
jgi:hypothetical protein